MAAAGNGTRRHAASPRPTSPGHRRLGADPVRQRWPPSPTSAARSTWRRRAWTRPGRQPPGPNGQQRTADRDHVLRAGTAQRPGQPAQTQPGVRDDDDRAGPPARVDRDGEVDARRDQQGDPVAPVYAPGVKALRRYLDPVRQLGETDALGPAATELNDGRPLITSPGQQCRGRQLVDGGGCWSPDGGEPRRSDPAPDVLGRFRVRPR